MRCIISLCAALLLLSACVGSSDPTTFYSLKEADGNVQTFPIKNNTKIGILPVSVPEYIDVPQIVMLDSASIQVKKDEFNRWAENLAGLLQRTIAEDIAKSMPKSIAKTAVSSSEGFDYVIKIEVNKFEGAFDHKAHLNVWWTIYDTKQQTLTTQPTKLEQKIDNTYESYVLAQSSMLSKLSIQIAKKISDIQAKQTDENKAQK